MKKVIIISFLFSLVLYVSGQTIDLTFTAVENDTYFQLDSIKVMNRTQGGDTVLYYPDTVLVLDFQVGMSEFGMDNEGFQVYQNYPNPVGEQTTIPLYVPEMDRVCIIITDILGRTILQADKVLAKGMHNFRFVPGNGNIYFFFAQWKGYGSSIKILHISSMNNNSSLEYVGSIQKSPRLKAEKAVQEFLFNLGDELLYIGYIDTLQSGILNTLEESQTYTFQFATNIPCPETPTVEYEGQVYNTIQIFSQCWLKENLNVGEMINGSMHQSNNGTIEKYCYNNEPDSCIKYGALYEWGEIMHYTYQQGVRGICPPGWHLPTDEEWKVLEGAVDNQHGIGDDTWDDGGYRGYDAGTNLKTTIGWNNNGNGMDLFGFSGLPGGDRSNDEVLSFFNVGTEGYWWTSTSWGMWAWLRTLYYDSPEVNREALNGTGFGFSVRCLKDN